MQSPKSTPIDYSDLQIKVTPIPGSNVEHFGSHVRTPDTFEVQVSGTIKILVSYDRSECTSCSSWDGFRCVDKFDEEDIVAALIETIEDAKPILVWVDELQSNILIQALGFTQIEPSFAVAEVLAWEVSR